MTPELQALAEASVDRSPHRAEEPYRRALIGIYARLTATYVDLTGHAPPRPPAGPAGTPCGLVFLDPPYRSGLGPPALTALAAAGWIAPGAICVLEIGTAEHGTAPGGFTILDERRYGKAKLVFMRFG
jgi:16S rRNA G966 N2-methylase RsmD